jgi:hypothetical protein
MQLEPAPRTVRGARDLLSVALQYGNAFGVGMQAAALKPADYFGNDDVLYLMEDMATGEIRLSILWEWLHKNAAFTADDPETGVKTGDRFTADFFKRLLAEEYEKLRKAGNRDVHDSSKNTTLPVAREIVETYVLDATKLPWYVDLLNINLENHDLAEGGTSEYEVDVAVDILCPSTPNGVIVPFELPPDALYQGSAGADALPGTDAWRVGSLEAAYDFVRAAMIAGGYGVRDVDGGQPPNEPDAKAFGMMGVGECWRGGVVFFEENSTTPPTMTIWDGRTRP